MVENHLKFVNEQLAFQQKIIEGLAASPNKQKFHKLLLERYEALRNYLMNKDNRGGATGGNSSKGIRLSLTPSDIAGLPESLLEELSISEDRSEFAVLNVLEDAGGIASLDQLLVGIFKKTKDVYKRQALTAKLYRMSQKELIWGVPGKKGVYSTRPLTQEEADKLIGGESNSV